jgi:hypothetical protein
MHAGRGVLRARTRAVLATVSAACLLILACGATADGPTSERGVPEELLVGVVPQAALEPGETDRMRRGGIESVRFWLSWAAVEERRDEYIWAQPDSVMREIASGDLEALPFLFGTPEWAAARDGRRCAGPDCIPFAPASIETRHAFARFAAAAVRRYGPDGTFWEENPDLPKRPIRVWQIWNEPNLQIFFEPDVDASDYADILRRTASAIRSEDGDAEIVSAGLVGKRSSKGIEAPGEYLDEFYAVPDIGDSFDGIAVHPYDPKIGGTLDRVEAVLEAARRAEDEEVGLWVTEIGWASAGPRSQILVKTPREQARLLRRTYKRFFAHKQAWDLRGVYWYAWRDTPRRDAVCRWCPASGLRKIGGQEKPAFRALRRVSRSG